MRRITADLDYGKLKSFYYLAKCFFTRGYIWHSIEIRRSPRNKGTKKKGFHLIAWFTVQNGRKIPIETMRAKFGDDKRRITMDRKRSMAKQTLFTKKTKIKWRPILFK